MMHGESIGVFVALFLTFCVLSYLYADNPFYKLAEHLFAGLSIGFYVATRVSGPLTVKLYDRLVNPDPLHGWAWSLVPLVLCLLMLARYVRPLAWLGRIPIAFAIGSFAGLNIQLFTLGVLLPQTAATIAPLTVRPGVREAGELCLESAVDPGTWTRLVCSYGEVVNHAVILVGVCCALAYFFWSRPRQRALSAARRTGMAFIMVAFGATYGYAVMSRVSAAIGRAEAALAAPWASIAALLAVVSGLALWSRARRRDEPQP